MWNDSGNISLVLPLLIAFPAWYWLRKRSKNTLPYPPGPRAYPLIGSVLGFPLNVPLWEGFSDLAKRYGMALPSHELPGPVTLIVDPPRLQKLTFSVLSFPGWKWWS